MLLKEFYKKKNDSVDTNATLQFVVEKMYKESLRYMAILDSSGFPVGILTQKDILFLYNEEDDFNETSAYEKSTKSLIKANSNREIEYALNLMIDHVVRRVIVVDDRGLFLGVVEQEEIIFEYETKSVKEDFKIFEILMNELRVTRVDISLTLKETLAIMESKNIGSILVTKDDKSVGIVTETDILKLAKNNISKDRRIDCFMHSPIIKVSIKSSLHECIVLMRENSIRHLVVEEKDNNGNIVEYIMTSKDILNNIQGNYSKFLERKIKSQRATFENLEDLIIEAYDFGDVQVVSWANKSAKDKLHINIDDSIDKILPFYVVDELLITCHKKSSYTKAEVQINDKFYHLNASSINMFGTNIIKILLTDFTDLYFANLKLSEQVHNMNDTMNECEMIQNEILNQKSIGIGYISLDGTIMFANEYMLDLLGYTKDELFGKSILEITHKDDLDKTLVKQDLSIGTSFSVEKRYIHKDGYPIWVHITMSYSIGIGDKPKYIIGFIKDIRERKENEKRLKLAFEVFNNTNEGILITDKKLNIQAVNGAFSDITGYMKEDVINKNLLFMIAPHNDKDFYKEIWKSVKRHGFWKGEMCNARKNGEIFPQWLNISTINDDNGNIINYIGVFSDITSIKRSEAELEFLAHHDSLTKLPNRSLLKLRLSQAIKKSKRKKNKLAVLFLDLDRFKEINDTFGHSYGDEILKMVTKRFKHIMRDNDTIARIGGDEFVILIEDIEDISDIDTILSKLLHSLEEEFIVNKHSFKISVSIGIAIYPDDGKHMEDLIKNADAAMYQAKDEGRNTYRFYTQEMTAKILSQMFMKNEIDKAIKNKEFELHYQPQVSIVENKIIAVEALIRWRHPNMGLLYPDRFIKIAEHTKQIIQIGKQVLQMACRDVKNWIENEGFIGKVAVNVSAVQILQNDFYQLVVSVLEEFKLDGRYLELELTESFLMKNPKDAIILFKKLKKLGVTLSIDDFGTGYSSLSYLKQLPVDKLKIDKSFISDIPEDKDDMAITSTIISMSKTLGLGVIAEGVETQEQHEFLKNHGCLEGQGYLYSKPISSETLLKFMRDKLNV